MDRILGKIDKAILVEYAEIKQQGSILAGIDNLYRQLRFCNPELALYVKKKMLQAAKEQGDLNIQMLQKEKTGLAAEKVNSDQVGTSSSYKVQTNIDDKPTVKSSVDINEYLRYLANRSYRGNMKEKVTNDSYRPDSYPTGKEVQAIVSFYYNLTAEQYKHIKCMLNEDRRNLKKYTAALIVINAFGTGIFIKIMQYLKRLLLAK